MNSRCLAISIVGSETWSIACHLGIEAGTKFQVWSALALPTLKLVQPRLRYGAVVLTDNIISGAEGFRDIVYLPKQNLSRGSLSAVDN